MGITMLLLLDHVIIETLRNEKRSLRYIANYLSFSTTPIVNEVHRLKNDYQAQLVQADYQRKISQRRRKNFTSKKLQALH